MNFKEIIANDLEIFLNPDEFGEIHELEGQPTLIVIDENSFNQFSGTMEMENTMQGIFQSTLTIYVKADDFKKPDVGDRIKLDGNYYEVAGVSESLGLLTINLASYES